MPICFVRFVLLLFLVDVSIILYVYKPIEVFKCWGRMKRHKNDQKNPNKSKRNCQVYWLTAPKTSLQTEGALETVSSVEDMEEGEIHDDTMEDIVVSQDENQIEEGVEERKITRDKHGLVGNLKEQTKVCEDPQSKDGKECLPKKEDRLARLNRTKGKQRDHRLPLAAQFELDPNPDRVQWLQQLLNFMERIGSPILCSPTEPQLVCPGPDSVMKALDLYKLYKAVKEEGGGGACTANNGWKNIAGKLFLPLQKAFVLKKIYGRYLLPYEENEVVDSLSVLLLIFFFR